MAAVTADQLVSLRATNNIVEETHAIGTAGIVYVGALANFVSSTGRVVSATAAASRRFAGLVTEIINESNAIVTTGTGNTAGTIKAKIVYGCEAWLPLLTALRTYSNLGKSVYVGDNVSLTDTTGAGTAAVRVVVGQLVELTDTKTKGWVALRVQGDTGAT